jgi:hypothetical protein
VRNAEGLLTGCLALYFACAPTGVRTAAGNFTGVPHRDETYGVIIETLPASLTHEWVRSRQIEDLQNSCSGEDSAASFENQATEHEGPTNGKRY